MLQCFGYCPHPVPAYSRGNIIYIHIIISRAISKQLLPNQPCGNLLQRHVLGVDILCLCLPGAGRHKPSRFHAEASKLVGGVVSSSKAILRGLLYDKKHHLPGLKTLKDSFAGAEFLITLVVGHQMINQEGF